MSIEVNQRVSDHLRSIARIYELKKEKQRSMAFNKAADAVKDLDQDITEFSDPTEINFVGPSTAEVITQFLETGTSDRYEKLNETVEQSAEVKLDLDSFKDIGVPATTALLLWSKYKIYNKDSLVAAIKAGTIENYELAKKVGYLKRDNVVESEAYSIRDVILTVAEHGKCEIVGSFRRNRPYIKDLDIVVVSTADRVREELTSAGYTILYGGDQKVRVKTALFECDVLVTTEAEYATAMLYLTGSREFNIKMRAYAKSLGYTLNEHGLFKGEEKLETPTEKSVFDLLNFEYKSPEDR